MRLSPVIALLLGLLPVTPLHAIAPGRGIGIAPIPSPMPRPQTNPKSIAPLPSPMPRPGTTAESIAPLPSPHPVPPTLGVLQVWEEQLQHWPSAQPLDHYLRRSNVLWSLLRRANPDDAAMTQWQERVTRLGTPAEQPADRGGLDQQLASILSGVTVDALTEIWWYVVSEDSVKQQLMTLETAQVQSLSTPTDPTAFAALLIRETAPAPATEVKRQCLQQDPTQQGNTPCLATAIHGIRAWCQSDTTPPQQVPGTGNALPAQGNPTGSIEPNPSP